MQLYSAGFSRTPASLSTQSWVWSNATCLVTVFSSGNWWPWGQIAIPMLEFKYPLPDSQYCFASVRNVLAARWLAMPTCKCNPSCKYTKEINRIPRSENGCKQKHTSSRECCCSNSRQYKHVWLTHVYCPWVVWMRTTCSQTFAARMLVSPDKVKLGDEHAMRASCSH